MQITEALLLPAWDHCTVTWVLHPGGKAQYYLSVQHESTQLQETGSCIDAGLQQKEQPIEVDTKEEGECTDQDDQEMPPLEDESMDDDSQTKTFPHDPWNNSTFTLQDRLDQLRWESLELEPNFEAYGYDKAEEQRQEIFQEIGRIHRCVDQMKKMLQSISESQESLRDFMIQKATIKLQVNQISRDVQGITQSINLFLEEDEEAA